METHEAMMMEAEADMESAELLFSRGKYARALFFYQQAVEKAMKACLMKKGYGTVISHNVLPNFLVEFPDIKERTKIADAYSSLVFRKIANTARITVF